MSTADIHGPRFGAYAATRAELYANMSRPAWLAVADATGLGAGTRLLDIACGSGEFLAIAAARGAVVSGIDAAEGMIEVARRALPRADLRVGAMETLPWPDATFDLVTGFNAFSLAADMVAALAQARRVTRPGGRVAVCNWTHRERNDLYAISKAILELRAPDPELPTPPAFGEPGVLEDLARQAGLEPGEAREIDVPWEAPDRDTLERALLSVGGGYTAAIELAGEDAVRQAVSDAAQPFRRPDGSYRFENKFRYLITHN